MRLLGFVAFFVSFAFLCSCSRIIRYNYELVYEFKEYQVTNYALKDDDDDDDEDEIIYYNASAFNDDFKIDFILYPNLFEIQLLNKTKNFIEIDWNKVSVIHDKLSERVFTGKYWDKNNIQITSYIPFNSLIREAFYISRYAYLNDNWKRAGYGFSSFSLCIPLKINGSEKVYFFNFRGYEAFTNYQIRL